MGQIFSKCLGSSEKADEQPVVPPTATLSGVATVPNEPIDPPPGVTAPPNKSTRPPPAVAVPSDKPTMHPPGITALPNQSTGPPPAVPIPANESTVPLSQKTTPTPEPIVLSSRDRDFWGEAVEMLPKEYKVPEEWRTTTIDRESVVGMVQAKMEECRDKQWKIVINGKEVIVREVFGKTLDWMQKLAFIGDAVVQYAPVNASLPWQGFRCLLKVAVSDNDAYGGMLVGLERATWLASYCSAQECLFREYFADNDKYSQLNNAFIDDLVHLDTAILKFLIRAHKYYAERTAARVADAVMGINNSVGGLLKAIDDRKGRMENYASLAHKSNVHQNLKDVLKTLEPFSEYVSEEAKRRKEEERREFLNWLSDIDYKGDHDANSRNILKGSGDWLLSGEEKFRSWKERGGLLWLCGIAGAGKTKLTSTVIDHLMKTDENHTVAYFYCIRDTKQPRKEDPEEILRAILKQLVILLPSRLSAPVKAKYEEEKEKGGAHGSIKSLTFEDCAYFIVELATSRSVTIVIDALDECRENKDHSSRGSYTDRQDLLEELATKESKVRVFVSSRVDSDIQRRLENYPTIAINASKNGDDILNFIKWDVDDLMKKKRDWRHDETLREQIITTVSERANGMFRFAALQIAYLRSLNTRGSVRRRLQNLPTTLVQLYNEIYGRISSMEEDESSLAKRALSWLLCAHRQLSSSELLAAVSPTPDELVNEDELLRVCRHLVVLNPVSKSFELAHLSVREYLETRDDYKDGHPHAVVAERCIRLFDVDDPQDILTQYATLYWVDHYKSSPRRVEDASTDLAKKFFRNKGVNPAFEKWAKLAKVSTDALPLFDDLASKLQDTSYKPLSLVSVYGFSEVLYLWMDTAPGYSFFRDSEDMVVQLAIKWGNEDTVRCFLQQDKQPTIDKFGWTGWVWAAYYTQIPVLEVLKELYGDVDAQDEMGWTALHWMVLLVHTGGLKVLVRVGAGSNMTDNAKWTPLHWAAFLGRDTEAEELVAGGEGLDAEDGDRLTPFQWANFVGHEDTMKHLSTGAAVGGLSASLAPRGGPILKVCGAKLIDFGFLTFPWSPLLLVAGDYTFAGASPRVSDGLKTLLLSQNIVRVISLERRIVFLTS